MRWSVAIPSEQWGEAVGAAVVLKAGARSPPKRCSSGCASGCAPRACPSASAFVSELPYNEMGKVLRRVVRRELQTLA